MEMKRLVLHVERLVLNGFRPQDRDAMSEALREELGRQMAAPGLARDVAVRSDTAHVRVGPLTIPRTLRPDQAGAWIARVIARGLKP
jgi:hypothetical protein